MTQRQWFNWFPTFRDNTVVSSSGVEMSEIMKQLPSDTASYTRITVTLATPVRNPKTSQRTAIILVVYLWPWKSTPILEEIDLKLII